jgi:hypothetical protein
MPVKPTERRVRGGKDPNAVDLTPKLPDRTRPRAPERRVAATRGRPDGGEEPETAEIPPVRPVIFIFIFYISNSFS